MAAGETRRGGGRRVAVVALVLLLLLLVGGAAWRALTPAEPEPGGGTEAPAGAAVRDEPSEPPPRRRERVSTVPETPGEEVAPDGPREEPTATDRPGPWRVVDATAFPVVGAEVRLLDGGGADVDRLVSGEAGMLDLGDDPAPGLRLRVTAAGYADLDVAVADLPDRIVRLVGRARIAGRVLDDAGRGVPGAVVLAVSEPRVLGTWPGVTVREWRTTTDADGAFVLDEIPPRAMRVRAETEADGDRPPGVADAVVERPPVEDLVLRLGPRPVVSGRVLGVTGEPLAGARIAMRARMPDGMGGRVWSTSTDEEGRFSIDDVTPANTLWAWVDEDPQLAMAVLTDVPPGGAPIDVRLVPGGPLEASVVDESGQPFTKHATFYVLDAEGRLHNSANVRNGRVRTHVLPFDTPFDLLVQGQGGLFGRVDDVRAGARGLVVRLRPVPPIRGRVVLPDGSAAPSGTIVRAWGVRTSTRVRDGLAVETQVGADGRFTLDDVADLSFDVWAEPDDAGRAFAASALVEGVRPGSEVALALRQGAELSGRVEGVRSVRSLAFFPEGDLTWSVRTRTNAKGEFLVRALAAGTYDVWVQVPPDRLTHLGTVTAPATDVVLRRADR